MEKRDIREYPVSVTRKLKEIDLLENPVEILNGHLFIKADKPEGEISISDISFMEIQFQVAGEEKDSFIVALPMVFGEVLSDMVDSISNDMMDEILHAVTGDQYEKVSEYMEDDEPEEEESEGFCIWEDFHSGITAIAGILAGNLSQYITEKYGKGMTTDNMSEVMHIFSNVILDIMEKAAIPMAKQYVNEAFDLAEADMEKEEVSAPMIDITERIKK